MTDIANKLRDELQALIKADNRKEAHLLVKSCQKILTEAEDYLKTSFNTKGLPDGLAQKLLRTDRAWVDKSTTVAWLRQNGYEELIKEEPPTYVALVKAIGTGREEDLKPLITEKPVYSIVEDTNKVYLEL